MCKCVVLVVEFTRSKYTGSESSGFVEVVVIISGGSSTSPINVMVTTIEQSATGEGYVNNYGLLHVVLQDQVWTLTLIQLI